MSDYPVRPLKQIAFIDQFEQVDELRRLRLRYRNSSYNLPISGFTRKEQFFMLRQCSEGSFRSNGYSDFSSFYWKKNKTEQSRLAESITAEDLDCEKTLNSIADSSTRYFEVPLVTDDPVADTIESFLKNACGVESQQIPKTKPIPDVFGDSQSEPACGLSHSVSVNLPCTSCINAGFPTSIPRLDGISPIVLSPKLKTNSQELQVTLGNSRLTHGSVFSTWKLDSPQLSIWKAA